MTLALFLAVVNSSSAEVLQNEAAAVVKLNFEESKSFLKVTASSVECSVIWKISQKGGDLSLQSLCQSKPLSEQIAPIRSAFEALLQKAPAQFASKSLNLSLCCFSEIDREITLAAFRSPKWSSAKGYAINNDSQGTVTELSNASLPKELFEVFSSFGFEIKAKRTHRLTRLPAKETPYYTWLKERGVEANAILPAHPVVYWRLTPK